jgi:hypothetical protein
MAVLLYPPDRQVTEGISMKRLSLPIRLLAVIALATAAAPAMSSDVGVSISIGQPGFYGQIDIGQLVRPQVIYTQPMVIDRAPRAVVYAPIYLRVPPGHARNWRQYCGHYTACGRPVYFVRDDWYNRVYVPYHRSYYRNDYRYYDRYSDRYSYQHNDRNWRDTDRGNRYYNDNNRNDSRRNRGNGRRDD